MPARPFAFALLLALLGPATAEARPTDWVFDQEDDPKRFDLSLLGSAGFDAHVGGSIIFGIALAPRGFIPDRNDAFFLEFDGGAAHRLPRKSGDIGHGSAHFAGGVRYQLHLLTWFAPYLAVRGGARLWFRPDRIGRRADPYISGAIGAFFYPDKVFALRVEVGWPGVRGGIVFYF